MSIYKCNFNKNGKHLSQPNYLTFLLKVDFLRTNLNPFFINYKLKDLPTKLIFFLNKSLKLSTMRD